MYFCGTHSLTRLAIQTEIHLINKQPTDRCTLLFDRFHQPDATTGRRKLVSRQSVRRTHRQAKTAAEAAVQNVMAGLHVVLIHAQRDLRRKGIISAPLAKPPMCAHQAIPLASAPRPRDIRPLRNCIKNQIPRKIKAGSSTI